MKKYLLTYKMAIQRALSYRSVEIIWIISAFLTPLLFMTLWINNSQSPIENFNLSEIVTYYFIVTLVSQVITPHVEYEASKDINSGKLSFFLIKPYKYFIQLFIQEIAVKNITLIFNLLSSIFFYIAYRNYINIPKLSTKTVILMLILSIFNYFLIFLCQYLLAIISFWVTQIRPFFRAFHMTSNLFSGRLFPLIIMPSLLLNISKFLPLQYFWYIPTLIILGKTDLINIKTSIITVITWTIIISIIINFAWKKGVKNYSFYGG